MSTLLSLLRDECGSNAIEYALLASLIAIAIIGAVFMVGQNIQSNFFGPVASNLK